MTTIDRRVARTRAALQHAHLALIVAKGYDAVTVEDICEAANVGRSTFYAHYTGKDDLHRSGLANLRRMLVEGQGEARGGALDFSLAMFEHAKDHLELYRALTGSRGGVMAIEEIRHVLCDLVRQGLPADRFADAPRREFGVQYLVGAYLALLTAWLDGGATAAPAEMDRLFRTWANEGLPGLRD